ncbi:regulation of nuclear pre-mRNA domain-containing protein 2a [Sphaeramia orbicularis]|uniref:Regulation of nuclear pre-mRNA domain-containing protein 2 n=1 Tax=Sphaeramia orbicularis TaxID=375764 RepID=A0A672YR22_9TELE|nr:regulation of nuclear pre-mRNA domain-containing protein 2-like [Sphaeramia orbicularis]
MAAGAGASSGGSFESTLDRKFQNVTNTMDSIQGLSTWCIENKKYHSLIVRHWLKRLKKSDSTHRLNLFYLANDVIQNCKRKNAIVYRTAFAEVLPDAFLLLNREGEAKVVKSVERILSIWEDRSVYSGALISELRSTLVKEESPPETPVEQKTPIESNADLRSKIVAEFVPQAFIDQLSKYKRSVEEVDLREKQLTAMRVDICSSDALKKLKDKAGGKKFSKDFEEGSAQLQEFVKFLEKQSKIGPPVLEALSNADIFYEMQYKEVKIVANAYQTFANRVSHLKRKLDSLKATLPDLDDSPIPSPSADAPSPTGSESPFHGMELADPDPDLDGLAMDDDAEPPAPSPLSSIGGSPKPSLGTSDNREVEDMELSDEEMDSGGIIVEEQSEFPSRPEGSVPASKSSEPSAVTEQPLEQVTPVAAAPAASVEGVDLGKIGSILNSLSSAMKNTGPVAETPTPASAASSVDSPSASVPSQDSSSLSNLLSKVDVSAADLLSALSKVQAHGGLEGITSLLSSPARNISSDSSSTGKIPPPLSSASAVATPSPTPSPGAPKPSSASTSIKQRTTSQGPPHTSNSSSTPVPTDSGETNLTTETEPSLSSDSLESKIHSFLQGNPAFNAFDLGLSVTPGNNLSPAAGMDPQDGTPVRDEGGSTPTQDEIMDKPGLGAFTANTTQPSAGETVTTAPLTYQNNNPQQQTHAQTGVVQNGQAYKPYMYSEQKISQQQTPAPVAHYQRVSAPTGAAVPGERAPGIASTTNTVEGFQGVGDRGWYGDTYPEGSSQQPRGFNMPVPAGAGENKLPGHYPYQADQAPQPPEGANTSPGFFLKTMPPLPKLPPPPPPVPFDAPPSAAIPAVVPPEQQPMNTGDTTGPRVNSVISGMVVHDHQHKSVFQPDEPLYNNERPPHPPEYLHSEGLQYQEDVEPYHDEIHHHDARFYKEDSYHHPADPFYRPGSPPHPFPRVRGRLTPPVSPSEEGYYGQDYQPRGPSPAYFGPRRPPPPRHEIRHPGVRPPHRPPHPARHPHPRGPPPRAPFPRFQGPGPGPEPWSRGKRPPPRRGGNAGPMFPPKRPFPPPRY